MTELKNEKECYLLSKEETFTLLETSGEGLSGSEADKRIEKYGENALEGGKTKNIIILFLEQFKDVLIIILLIAAGISALMGDYKSFVVITAVVILNAILGTVQTKKAESSLNSLKQLSAPNAKVMRDGKIEVIPSSKLTIGDIVYLEAGDAIPADGRIIESASLQINESALTGESLSVNKSSDTLEGITTLAERLNMVYSASFVTYGRGIFVVTGIGMDTEVGKIAKMIKGAKETKTPLQRNMDEFGKKLSIIIIILCAILFGLSVFRGETVIDSFMFAIALAVAAIPEALSSIVTIVLSFGTQKMVKEKAIVRKLQAVEALGSVSVICSDKTGTLTQNKMTVCYLYTHDNLLDIKESKCLNNEEETLIKYSILCSDADKSTDGYVGDPTEIALLEAGIPFNIDFTKVRSENKRVGEIPFDSDRKLMSVVTKSEGKLIQITKGAVDVLIDRMNLNDEEKNGIIIMNRRLSEEGLRVLAVSSKENIDNDFNSQKEIKEQDLMFAGLIAMMDPPRKESKEAVESCKMAGITPVMITGDHKITASAIAKKIGILEGNKVAVEGSMIDELTDKELMEKVEDIAVYARVTPEHKIRIVRAWQSKGKIVAMTGDGVNDAPALKQADIGVAMGITGTEVSKDASSVVLADDNFATIVKAVENGRNIYANIKRAIKFLLSGNIAGILMVLYASLMNLPVPFLAVHLLFINLLTDSLPAIALGLEPHKKGVMNEKPRDAKESILTKSFLISVLTEGFVISVFTAIGYSIGLKGSEKTMAFAVLCISRLLHGFSCKSKKPVLFKKEMFNNKYLIGAFLIGLLLQSAVLFIPVLKGIFEVTSLTFENIVFIYLLAIGSFLINQFLKFLNTKKRVNK